MLQVDWLHLAFVVVMGACLTMAFKTGTLWPAFPTVTRAEAPRKFWLGVAFYSFWIIGFFAGLLFFLLGWTG